MSTTKKSLLAIIGLILATTAALAAMGTMGTGNPSTCLLYPPDRRLA